MSAVKALIAAGADVNATYRFKNACYGYGEYASAGPSDTALMLATRHSKIDIVRALISAGVNVNAANEYGETALLFAIKDALGNPWRSAEEVKTLLAKALINAGANVDVADKYGNTPLKLAKERGYTEIVDAIHERLK